MATRPVSDTRNNQEAWPALPLAEWVATRDTLHMWTQIVGKLRMALSPYVNHWWQVPLYVSARGLTTSAIPYPSGNFDVEFDFIDHTLRFITSSNETKSIGLTPRTVADFYREFLATLKALQINATIWPVPVEIPNPIRFDQDTQHASYDPEYANRFWRVLVAIDKVLKEFRGRFIGKASPVHFFWGSFDLAATRFSGRRAPDRFTDRVMKEAYSHEVSSAGWWPGGGDVKEAMFYAYAAPVPEKFSDAPVRPQQAFYQAQLGEFLLPYEAVRTTSDPSATLMDFLQTTYEAAANTAHWDRAALERQG